ncbi:TonB-dependent receptor domain-containing protein [Pedobacter agri]|uniref:TonB-dependent receptor domain-containing protein n=1 Tax=Pedobacter agri TaxID=454586 RepID=UPI000E36AEE8|nr:TonB-dependent receptor [Pedobacter agri]MDQ1139848.1 ferric enterobactin receptor [Pedobacter agri]
MKRVYIFVLLLFAISAQAQQGMFIEGKVIDQQNKPIPSANIKIIETNQYGITAPDGSFKLPVKNLSNNTLTLEFTFISYQKLVKKVLISGNGTNLGNVILKELNLSLETIDINAKRNYEGQSNSSLIISRDIIEQTPALSVADLLNQLPNRKIVAPSLQSVQNITLRSSFAPTTNGRGAFEMNNSFGVAIIVDGNAISNNMNMQSFNPGLLGAGNSLISGSYSGLNGAATPSVNGSPVTSYSGDFAFSGTDLRQIPADNIENIEVISGVAPAKYGDLTDGAVIIDRQAGKAPGYLRMQIRDNATSYGYSQGFKISEKAGAVNVGINYVNSFGDNRDRLKAYKRINTSAMYSNSFGIEKRLKNTLSLDYGRNLDGLRGDNDDITRTILRFDSWNFSVANRSNYRINSNFLKSASLNLRYAEGHQVSYREQFRNEPYLIVSDATTTGIHEGSYAPGIYTAASLIDGRPVNASAKLDFNADFKMGEITHFLGFGVSYDYGVNKGDGQVLDPSRPRAQTAAATTSLTPNRSERYYDFNLAVPQRNVGFYLEDLFKVKMFNRDLNVRAGLRYDIQNALPSFSPRLNMNYAVDQNLRFGFSYGLSFKSPSLGQRYPGPTYFEIPIINSFNGNAAESIYLVYVNRYDHNSSNLKSSKSQTFEFTSQLKLKEFNLSLSLFNKQNRNGINTISQRNYVTLPTYVATIRPGQQPMLTQTGTRTVGFQYSYFGNDLLSDNQGVELILNTPKIKAISTTFNVSGGLFRTNYETKSPKLDSFEDNGSTRPDYAIIGYYEPEKRVSFLSNARISSSTHIPKISLIVNFIAEFSLLQKTVQSETAGIPYAYLTREGRYIDIPNFDALNLDYGHLYKPASEINENNIPRVIPNFHLSLAKEIKKRFRFSFNVYNVFNYQPYYINTSGSYIYPSSAPSFGAEISIKL